MKLNMLLLFLYIIIEIKCRQQKKGKKIKEKQKNKEEELNEEENGRGIMTDEEFEEKLQKILEEKNIKKNKKITKDILKKIFDDLYSKEFDIPEIPEESSEDIDPRDETLKFLNEVFGKLTHSLDYDDEIEVSDIKNWISPMKVKESVNEIIENLVGMIGGGGNDL